MTTSQVSFTIDDKMLGQLDVIAARENRSRSNMIRQLIKNLIMVENYVDKEAGRRKST